jgi:hypothetical protein
MMGLVPTQARIYHVVPCSCRVKIVVFRAGLYSPVRLATYSRDEEMPFKQPPQSNPSLFESNVPKSATGSSSRFAPAAFHRNAAQQHRVQLAGTQNQGPARSRLQLLTVSAPFSRAEMSHVVLSSIQPGHRDVGRTCCSTTRASLTAPGG